MRQVETRKSTFSSLVHVRRAVRCLLFLPVVQTSPSVHRRYPCVHRALEEHELTFFWLPTVHNCKALLF